MKHQCLVAITAGDVSGIGPEIIVRAVTDPNLRKTFSPLLVGHPKIFQQASALTGHALPLKVVDAITRDREKNREHILRILEAGHYPCLNPCGDEVLSAPRGRISAIAGDAAYQYLTAAIQLARSGEVDAIATAPLNKESLHLAGHPFPGHTEILAEHCGVQDFAMMLHLPESAIARWRAMIRPNTQPLPPLLNAKCGLSIAHVTLHTSIRSVPLSLSEEAIVDKVHLMARFLQSIQCERQAIAVCALNPHGSEHGLFGDEEERLIEPAVLRCQKTLPNVTGPLPVDTLIRRAIAGEFDGVVAMYHDQGHIPVKLIGFDKAVNITLGLPIIRTSPTHGTAFDRAWQPALPADPNGMIEAIRMATVLAEHGEP